MSAECYRTSSMVFINEYIFYYSFLLIEDQVFGIKKTYKNMIS